MGFTVGALLARVRMMGAVSRQARLAGPPAPTLSFADLGGYMGYAVWGVR